MSNTKLPPLPEPRDMDGARWGYDADDLRNYGVDAWAAGAAAERQRWINKAMAHRDMTAMSKFATLRECEAARNAIQSLLDDGA